MNKKYELLQNDTKQFAGITLYRIKYLKDFADIKAGDLGGYIECESTLSHNGNALVSGNAIVCGNARVWGNAKVWGTAKVWGNALVCGNARVWGNAKVWGNTQVYGDAIVYGNAQVYGDVEVFGDVEVTNKVLNIYNSDLFRYNITFTDYHISIGCQYMLFSEWLEVGFEDAKLMGIKTIEHYNNIKKTLSTMIPIYYGSDLR